MQYYISVLTKNYANFKGRARRKEYWMFVLCNVGVALILSIISMMTKTTIISTLYSLAILVPSLAVLIRRLHDVNKSGAWFFISLIPLVGWIWMLILLCKEGTSESNSYGNNPKE